MDDFTAFDTKRELRDMLQGNRIHRVDFGSDGPIRDERSITLHIATAEGKRRVRITATAFQTLSIEED